MRKVHSKETPIGMFEVTFISRASLIFYIFSCVVREVNSYSLFLTNFEPKALDSHLPIGKLLAINDSVI